MCIRDRFLVVFVIMFLSIPLFKKVQGRLDTVTRLTRENLTGVRVIRAFCREDHAVAEFDESNLALTKLNEFVGKISALLNPATYVLINIATVILIQTAGVQVNLGNMQQGEVVALYNYMAQICLLYTSCCRMNNDICAVLNRSYEVWCCKCIIYNKRNFMFVSDFCKSLNIYNIRIWVSKSLNINSFCVLLDRILHFLEIKYINKCCCDSVCRKRMLQKVCCTAVNIFGCYNVISLLCNCLLYTSSFHMFILLYHTPDTTSLPLSSKVVDTVNVS